MVVESTTVSDSRFLSSGDEAGTAPGDRRFRPDVEGLRAVAILLVVLDHAGIPHMAGGYVGVDVFFVISGFVITGLLLREHRQAGRTSIVDFYSRRCRRILPAATLVIVATVVATYVVLGVVSGNNAADDGRWAAVFLANFHFAQAGTNYLAGFRLPSPLQNYWSLSVEEQFYIVYPTLFLVLTRLRIRGIPERVRLSVGLGMIIGVSYWLSIVQTASHPASAYFSPFTRAWELALGALIAVNTRRLMQIPAGVAACLTWLGLAAIAVSAVVFNGQTTYPGALVAIPVLGAAAVIGGGVSQPTGGAETLLRLGPFGWLGRRSYSLYLWHWPILVIAAERVGRSMPSLGESLLLVIASVLMADVSYRFVENPIRHWRTPSKLNVGAGVALVTATFCLLSLVIVTESAGAATYHVVPAADNGVVVHQVEAAAQITAVPAGIVPPLARSENDYGGNQERTQCQAGLGQYTESICVLGDTQSHRLMIEYGDSHAGMWLPALSAIASSTHWRLVVLAKPDCPAEIVEIRNPPGSGSVAGTYASCDEWHRWALATINRMHPDLLIISQENYYATPSAAYRPFSRQQWRTGLTRLIESVALPSRKIIFLGNIPMLVQSGPECLAAHSDNVQLCSSPARSTVLSLDATEQSTTRSLGVRYVDVRPWFCSSVCTAVISRFVVYMDRYHVTATYATYLRNVLGQSLGLLPVPGHGA